MEHNSKDQTKTFMEIYHECKKTKDYARLKVEAEQWFHDNGYIKTKSFGWVSKKDAKEYLFLAGDRGIPTQNINNKDGRLVSIVSSEYWRYKTTVKGRSYQAEIKSKGKEEYLDAWDLAKEFETPVKEEREKNTNLPF